MFFRLFINTITAYYLKEKSNKDLWLIVVFACGIGFYFFLQQEPPKWLGLLLLEILVISAVLLRYRIYLLYIITLLGIFVFGFFIAQMRARSCYAPVFNGKSFARNVMGRVVFVEEGVGRKGQRVVLDNVDLYGINADETPKQIRVVLTSKSEKTQYGDLISVRAVLNRPFLPAVPYANNFARMAWFKKIGAIGYAVSRVKIIQKNNEKGFVDKIKFFTGNLRIKMSNRIKRVLPNNEGAIATALISGERGNIPDYLTNAYRDSGLAHFLSISGLHMSLVGGISFFWVRFILAFFPSIALAYDIKKWAAVAGIVATTCYLVVSGFEIPAERAYIMTTIVFVAVLINRRAISMRLIGFAGVIVLISNPSSLLSPSFQMSFAAVIALIAFYEKVYVHSFFANKDQNKSLFYNLPKMVTIYIIGVVVTDFVASLATLPFAVFHFNRVANYTLLANLLAAPIIGFIVMPFVVFSLALMPLGMEYPALKVAGVGLFLINKIVLWVSILPGSVTVVKAMPALALVLIVFGMLWLCFWKENWRYYGLLLIGSGIICHYLNKTPDIIAGNNGKMMVFKLANDDVVLSSSKIGFTSKIWLEKLGAASERVLKNKNLLKTGFVFNRDNLVCDDKSCGYFKYGKKIVILKQAKDIKKGIKKDIKIDCPQADLIISPFPLKKHCKGNNVIDFWDFRNNGNYSIFISPNGKIKAVNVRDVVGNRPWNN